MTKAAVRKIVKITGTTAALLAIVLLAHIYIVTRPKAPDVHAVAMARIDLKQPISQTDAEKITGWLYQQKGIDHVLCNPSADIVVFTYMPAKTNANEVVSNFKTSLGYSAERYMPCEEDMKGGCPVMANSLQGKVYAFFKRI